MTSDPQPVWPRPAWERQIRRREIVSQAPIQYGCNQRNFFGQTTSKEVEASLSQPSALGIALATALVLGACGGQPTTTKATVTGQVTWYRCFGATSPQRPCSQVPVADTEIAFTLSSGSATRGVTDAAGRYSVRLDTGDYSVSLAFPVVHGLQHLHVEPEATLQANFVLRFPAY
jgi:hypothetical protein